MSDLRIFNALILIIDNNVFKLQIPKEDENI